MASLRISHCAGALLAALLCACVTNPVTRDRGLVFVSEQDEILNELLYIKNRINTSAGILTDKTKTGFFFVVTPEAMIIEDTKRAAGMFAQFDVPVAGYLVNRVIPHELLKQNIPEYLRRRIAMQDEHMKGLRAAFDDQVMALVPEMERDVTGLPMIEKLANIMFA